VFGLTVLAMKNSIVAVSRVVFAAVEKANGIFVFVREVAEELDEANFIVKFELWTRRHLVECCQWFWVVEFGIGI